MKSYKLVFVGASGHTGYVLSALHVYPQIRLTAYAPSFAGEDMSQVAGSSKEGPLKGYEDWREMLESEKPDIITTCGRHDLNGPIAIEAARRGCHIISEKPAALTLQQVQELHQIVTDHSLLYASMLAMRYEASYYTAHQLVREGIIGEPYLVTAQKSYRWGTNRPEWYADPKKYGSSMAWVGIHAFDFARWVSGVDYTEVFAYHNNLVHTERPGCQDVSTVIARLTNGGSAVFNLDYLRPAASPTHGDDRLRIAGPKGVLEVCDQGQRLHVITAEKDVLSWPLIESGRTFLGDFVAALEGRGTLLIPAQEAFSITEFAIKAAQAADTGQIVKM